MWPTIEQATNPTRAEVPKPTQIREIAWGRLQLSLSWQITVIDD